MDASRRTALAGGAILAALIGTGAAAAPAPAPPGLKEVLHIYADAEGISHGRRVVVKSANAEIPVQSIAYGSIGAGITHWGSAPTKRFSINTVGDIEVELGDGTRHHVGKGDLVFIEDTVGTGHRSHFLTPVANLFIIVAEDFDFDLWAGLKEEAPA